MGFLEGQGEDFQDEDFQVGDQWDFKSCAWVKPRVLWDGETQGFVGSEVQGLMGFQVLSFSFLLRRVALGHLHI